MASRSYSRSKANFRSRTDSNSSDLFDEMVETKTNSDLKPSAPKLMHLDAPVATGHPKKKLAYPKATALYNYSYRNSPQLRNSLPLENSAGSVTEATPTSSQSSDSQVNSDGFGNSSMEDSEETSEATTSEAIDTSRLKVFDFDDENQDSVDCAVVKTLQTATKPRDLVGQTPVRRVRMGRVSRTSGVSAKRSKGTQMTLTSFNLLASKTGEASSSRSPEKGVRSSQGLRGPKGQTQSAAMLKPVKNAANVHGLTGKQEAKGSVGSRNVTKSKRGLVTKDTAVSKGSPSKNSPLGSNRAPVSKDGAKSSPTSSRNASGQASKGKETAVSKSSLLPSKNASKGATITERLPSQSKNTRVVAQRGGSARRIAFALKGVFQEEEKSLQTASEGTTVGIGVGLMADASLSTSSSPSTLPDFPVAGVPVRRGKLSNKTTDAASPCISLEPYIGSADQFQPDFPDDPFSFASPSTGSPNTGSKLHVQPNSGSKVVKGLGAKEFASRTKGESGIGESAQVKRDYSRRRADGANVSLLPTKTRTQPGGTLQNADSAADDMLHEIDALLEDEGGRGLLGVASSSSKSSTSPLTMGSNNIRDSKPLLRKSSSAGLSESLGLSGRTYLQRPANIPADPLSGGGGVPNLTKSSSWTQGVTRGLERGVAGGGVKKGKKLVTKVQNVREAHQCMEIGENFQFFEEAHYLLDNIKPSQPLHVRCLGICNLASHYLDPEFSRQLRAHSYTSRVTAQLKDALEHPPLCLSVAALFYVITRDKLNNEWDGPGTALLVGMLEAPDITGRELTGKAAREMARIGIKVRSILEKVADQTSQGVDTPPPEEEDSELPLSQPVLAKKEGKGEKNQGKLVFRVNTEDISVEELARECVISLTSPQNNPHWLRDELRIRGALDRLANMVISSCDELSQVDCSGLGQESCDYTTSITQRAQVMQRQLKSIENLTLMNKNNQSYLVIFDGSILLTKLTQFLKTCHQLLSYEGVRLATHCSLLAVLKVLLNLTHESELGSQRVGEQPHLMDNIFRVILQLPDSVPPEDRFDITVLALGLLINLAERSTSNCKLIESLHVDHVAKQPDSSSSGSRGSCDHSDDAMSDLELYQKHSRSSIRALVDLFLYHHQKADSASIDVPTPQRLSQLGGPSSQDPVATSELKERGVASCKESYSGRLKLQQGSSVLGGGHSSAVVGGVETTKGEEEFEQVELDPLVFDREEFNSALDQAGRHMEDSILSSYVALLLGILAEHNHDDVDYIRNLMPSRSFSEMMSILKEIASFMNITGSVTGLDSIKHTIKFLEAVQ